MKSRIVFETEKPKKETEIVKFGRYPQTEDGVVADIEWLVLGKTGGMALLISKYSLDCASDEKRIEPDEKWEKSSLRKWLNTSLYKTAFNRDEQSAIIPAVLENRNFVWDWRTDWSCDGKRTADRVFILSQAEAYRYFDRDEGSLKCRSTPYCRSRGALSDDDCCCCWWLREGFGGCYATLVSPYGDVDYLFDMRHARGTGGVRPAVWVNLSRLFHRPEPAGNSFYGASVAVTGQVNGMSRRNVADRLKRLNATVSGYVNEKTAYLIVGASPGVRKLSNTLDDGMVIDRCLLTDGAKVIFEASADIHVFDNSGNKSFLKYLMSKDMRIVDLYFDEVKTESGSWRRFENVSARNGKYRVECSYDADTAHKTYKSVQFLFEDFDRHVASWKIPENPETSSDPAYFIEGVRIAVMDDGTEVELCLWHDNEMNISFWDVSTDKETFNKKGEKSFVDYLKRKG
ncbi:MAG: hypothetical protein IKX86_04130, partial [Clostridia bacterium]|nr:hypothetical protein [Clostridia bacterium]